MKNPIKIVDDRTVNAKVCRFIEMEDGSCSQSLPVRIELTGEGWTISFFGQHGIEDAARNYRPLTALPAEVADLAIEALKLLKQKDAEWRAGK